MFFQQLVNGVVLGSIYALSALGFTLIFGVAGVINFAYGEMLMLGAFTTLVFKDLMGLNFFVSLLLAMFVMGGVSLLFYQGTIRPVLKASELNALLVTTGLLYVLREGAVLIWGTGPRSMSMGITGSLEVGGVLITYQRLTIVVVTLLLIAGLYHLLNRTRIGRALRAVAQDRDGALAVGLNIHRTTGFGFALSGMLGCAAGGLMGSLFTVEPQMGAVPLLKAFGVVIFGGLGSVPGAIVGGLAIGLLETFAGAYISFAYKDVFAFLIMIAVLLYKPSGLLGGERL